MPAILRLAAVPAEPGAAAQRLPDFRPTGEAGKSRRESSNLPLEE